MKRGKNVWENNITGEKQKSETRPGEGVDVLDWWPAYPESRVSGSTYQPYSESTEWGKMANQAMAATAQRNFQNGRK